MAVTEAIFVLPQTPPGPPTRGHDGSYFCSSPSTSRDSGSPGPRQHKTKPATKPFAELIVLKADEVKVGSSQQDEVLQTPVTAERILRRHEGSALRKKRERSAKEAAQEIATASGKRGRKRKSPALAGAKAKKARRSEVEVAEAEIAAAGLGDHCSVLQF